jgi:hypothetical protein
MLLDTLKWVNGTLFVRYTLLVIAIIGILINNVGLFFVMILNGLTCQMDSFLGMKRLARKRLFWN